MTKKRKYLAGLAAAVVLGTLAPLCPVQPSLGNASEGQGAVKKGMRARFWGELYNESSSSRRDRGNLISLSHIKQGLSIDPLPGLNLEMHVLLRYGKDLHKDFWNNKVEAGVGLRAKTARWELLTAYVEWIRGHYVRVPEGYPQPGQRDYGDVRTGLVVWRAWSKAFAASRLRPVPVKLWGEIYADVSYSRSQKDNVVGYLDTRWGPHLFALWGLAADGYGVAYLTKDVNKDFWNNKVEIGPGIWLRPVPRLDLKLSAEWLHGYYFGIEGEDPNPYPQHYRDRRAGLTVWVGW